MSPLLLCQCEYFNPTALRKAKIVYNFGLSKCNRVKCISGLCLMSGHAKKNKLSSQS